MPPWSIIPPSQDVAIYTLVFGFFFPSTLIVRFIHVVTFTGSLFFFIVFHCMPSICLSFFPLDRHIGFYILVTVNKAAVSIPVPSFW